jgi:hypothetical protein
MYMLWIQVRLKKNWNSFVCAHLDQASVVIRAMLTGALSRMPPFGGETFSTSGYEGARNIRKITSRGCIITVGSAESPDSIRAQNVKMAHFSEVALFPDTSKKSTASLVGAVIGTLKMTKLSLVVYESTARGVGDFFHSEWLKASSGKSPFIPVFVEWFLIDAYSEPIDDGYFRDQDGKRVEGTPARFVESLDERELAMFDRHDTLTLENLSWYRGKRSEFSYDYLMKQEYPSTPDEAFQGSGDPVFRLEDVEAMRKYCRPPVAIGTLSSRCPPALARSEAWRNGEILEDVAFVPDEDALGRFNSGDERRREAAERDKLKIWNYPDLSTRVSDRYVVVFDPQRGLSEGADWGAIAVFDRYWMLEGGVPAIVAGWKGRVDKDVAIWIAAQVARWYDNALLVIECNTYDTDTRDDYSEFIFDTIAARYNNIYSRVDADKIQEGAPVEYGFHMNRSSKPMVVFDYNGVLRERGYRERDEETLLQARVYERRANGRYEAKQGYHDDNLVTRMIGCWICYRLPPPRVIANRREQEDKKILGLSSM